MKYPRIRPEADVAFFTYDYYSLTRKIELDSNKAGKKTGRK
jgi:hypothetical protein